KEFDYEYSGSRRTARAHYLAELSASAQPALSDSIHQFHLQPEVRALLLLAKPQPPRRLEYGGTLCPVAISGAHREPEPFRRGTVLAAGVRRDLPPVYSPEQGPPDLCADEWLLYGANGKAAPRNAQRR